MEIKDIAWLAGILEGEGHFRYSKAPKISVEMSDEDVIKRVANLFGSSVCSRNRYSEVRTFNYTMYNTSLSGRKAIQWMFTLYSLMGERRKKKISEIIDEWKKVPVSTNFGSHACKSGHDLSIYKRADWRGRVTCKKCLAEYHSNRRKKLAVGA